ncbi:DUF5305 domain-containing protein [Haloferax sp. DFSO52]|uniref:DUF5305 domain-containing protein n=1 Tax=Haloferax sp. DFSO52 TaxID=3388505 RepID=UPI003A8B8129
MTDRNIRIQGVVADYFVVVVIVLLVLASVGAYTGYISYVNPGTHVEERRGASWATTAEFEHAATVSKPNSVYDVGTALEDRPAYFSAITPVLDGVFVYGYTASESGDLVVDTRSELVLQSVKRDQTGSAESPYWQISRTIDDPEETRLAPGETINTHFSVDVNELANKSSEIEEELGGTIGTTQSFVRVTVDISGTANGEAVDKTEVYTLPVGVGSVYTVSNPGEMTEEYVATQQVVVPNEPDPLMGTLSAILFVLSLTALGVIVVKKQTGSLEPTASEREYLAYRESRSDFDEWINRIELPSSAFDLPMAEAASLGDLVDFAIDTNNSVLEDPHDGTYYVIHSGYLYVYDPPIIHGDNHTDVDEHRESDAGADSVPVSSESWVQDSVSGLTDHTEPSRETDSS